MTSTNENLPIPTNGIIDFRTWDEIPVGEVRVKSISILEKMLSRIPGEIAEIEGDAEYSDAEKFSFVEEARESERNLSVMLETIRAASDEQIDAGRDVLHEEKITRTHMTRWLTWTLTKFNGNA